MEGGMARDEGASFLPDFNEQAPGQKVPKERRKAKEPYNDTTSSLMITSFFLQITQSSSSGHKLP